MREIYGDSVVVVPYVMPGFDLARVAAERFPRSRRRTRSGMVLLNHGFFSFGETAREAYERMIELVARAEAYLAAHGAWQLAEPRTPRARHDRAHETASACAAQVSEAAGAPMIVATHADAQALAFAQRADLATIAQQGPATPDHVIRTKRVAQIGRDVAAVQRRRTSATLRSTRARAAAAEDAGPRAARHPRSRSSGVMTIGRTAQDAAIAFDIYEHTIDIVLRATALGGYRALPAADIFAVEYWDLEQAKLRRGGSAPVFAGEVALVTGAASGIGKACASRRSCDAARRWLGWTSIRASCEVLRRRADFLGLECDVDAAEEPSSARWMRPSRRSAAWTCWC